MAQQKTRTFLLGRFEAGDRPTDQDFANLFESILFLNNGLSGHNNGLSTDNTTIEGNFTIGGTLDLTGNFKLGSKLSVGNTAEALQSSISAYNSDNFAVVFASGSLSNIMFEGVSQDVTSTIKLTETLAGSTPAAPSTNTLIFGTSAGRAFLQNDGQEILHMTSSGHNGSSPQVYISGSLGIGSGWDSGTAATGEQLHIQALGEGDATMRLTSDGTSNDSIIKLRQSNDAGYDLIYDGGVDKFYIEQDTGLTPFTIEYNTPNHTLFLDSSGDVGIGLINPTEKLHIKGTTTSTNALVQTTTGNAIFKVQTSVSQFSLVGNGTTDQLSIYDANSTNTPFKLEGGSPSYALMIDSNGRIGLGTQNPESNLHVLGLSDGSVPMMLIEGGGGIYEQDILILRDLGTGDENKNNIKFQTAAAEINIAQIQAMNQGSSATSGGDLNLFTYSDDVGTANTNQLYLKNNGRVGIGTASPLNTLHVKGTARLVVDDTNNNFLTFTSQASDQANQHYYVGNNATWNVYSSAENYHIRRAIDNPGTPNSKTFATFHAGNTTGGDGEGVEFSVPVTASFFKGDGSGLTGLQTAATVAVLNDGDNRIVTANGDNTLSAEAKLTFDGDQLTHFLNTGDTAGHGIILDGQNGGFTKLRNNTTTSNEFQAMVQGKASSGLTGAGVAGLVIEGQTATDHADNPSIILRSRDADGASASEHSPVLQINNFTTELITVSHDGNIGMGTTSPSANLHIASTADASIWLEADTTNAGAEDRNAFIRLTHDGSGNGEWYLGTVGSAGDDPEANATTGTLANSLFIGSTSAHPLALVTNNAARVTVTSGGKVGIGTNAPREKLDVIGRITVDNSTSGTPAVTIFGEQDSSTHPDIQFEASGVIAASGSLHMNIDADNTTTGTVFAINKNSNTSGATRVFTVNENGTIQLSDTAGTLMMSLSSQINQATQGTNYDGVFVGETDLRIHKISFPGAFNDSGFISHESQPSVNHAVLRLVPSDDASGKDYVSIGGSSQIEGIRLFNSGEGHFRGGIGVGNGFNQSGTNIVESIGAATIHSKTTGDAVLFLEADTDNTTEDHNAFIKLTQDDQGVISYLGHVGSPDFNPEGASSTSTLGNSLYLGTKTADAVQLVTSNVARLTVLSGGNIGIGTNAPEASLHVYNGYLQVEPILYAGSQNSWALKLGASNNAGFDDFGIKFKSTSGGSPYLSFRTTAGDDRMVIANNGNIGIGTSSPSTKLHVYAGSTLDNDILLLDGKSSGFGTGTAGLNEKHSYLTVRASGATAAEKISALNLKVDSTNLWQLLTDNNDGNRFHIQYNNDDSKRFLTVETAGNVGIGTNDPSYALDVAGSVMSKLSSTSGRFLLGGNTESGMVMESSHVQVQSKGHVIAMVDSNNNETDKYFKVQFNSTTVNGGTERFRVQEDGLVYINNGMYIQSTTGLSGLDGSVFKGESGTLRRHIFYFPAAAGSNDPGRIEHLTSTTLTNSAVIRLCPGDDQGAEDYVTICGSDEPEMIRLFTTGEGHFRGGLGVGELYNQTGTNVDGDQIAAGVIDIKSNADAGIFLRADVDNDTESHNAFIQMTQDGTLVGGIIGLGESATVGPRGDTIRHGTSNAMYMYSSDLFLDTSSNPADLHLGAGSTMALTITDKLGDEDVGVIIGPDTTHYKYGNDQYPALSIKMKGQNTIQLSANCAEIFQNANQGGGLAIIDNDSTKSAHIETYNGDLLGFGFRSNSSTSKVKTRGFVRGSVSIGAITFTGQHKNVPETGVADDWIDHVGKIVISKGTYKNLNLDQISDKPNINEALPKVALSAQLNDKRVWGVVSNAEDSSESNRTDGYGAFVSIYPKQDNRIIVNSVGEGGILVSNYNGDLENGDYVTTCPLEGLGMKQDDDLLHNYTVAKVTQDVTFLYGDDDVTEITYNGQTYKYKFVGCTYHCG